jgi:hypothetical protein
MNDDKIDFSPLDPARDATRWRHQVESVTARALERRRQPPLAVQLLDWARPTLLVAASIALLSWCGAAARQNSNPPDPYVKNGAPWILTRWAVSGEEPSVASMLEVLGAGQQ